MGVNKKDLINNHSSLREELIKLDKEKSKNIQDLIRFLKKGIGSNLQTFKILSNSTLERKCEKLFTLMSEIEYTFLKLIDLEKKLDIEDTFNTTLDIVKGV
ncbi:MAG: hypothetical protein NZZ41_03245 [Candidatus Dojkabacteria bacterium]|nr:hypothetical protein [Candidatus Dojkabacteria bacterium]